MIRLVPGQQLKSFSILRKATTVDAKGRPIYSVDPLEIGTFKGTLTQAKQQEREQWKQMGHPISHTVVVFGKTAVSAEDILILENRKFYVQGKDNPAELGVYEIIYCEERLGVGECPQSNRNS